jgi:hypothetical protein
VAVVLAAVETAIILDPNRHYILSEPASSPAGFGSEKIAATDFKMSSARESVGPKG